MITCRDVYNLRLDGVELLTGEIGLDFSKPYRVGIIVIDRKYGVNLEQNEHTYEYYTDCLKVEVTRMKTETLPGSIYLNVSTNNLGGALASAFILLLISTISLILENIFTREDRKNRKYD